LHWCLSLRSRNRERTRRIAARLASSLHDVHNLPPPANWNAFVQGLREIGYTEGQNIAFEHRSAHDQPELFPKLALELASLKVDVIFARGTCALAAAKNATRSIPIVGIDLESDPIEAGLVASIARPGGNITGLFLDLSELSGKHLQFLKEIMPRASRAAVLGNPDINALQIRELERVARSLELQIRAVDVRNATDLDGAFDTAKNWRADALIVLSNPLSLAYRTRIGDLAEKAGLPSIYLYRAHVDAGGLISYGPDLSITSRPLVRQKKGTAMALSRCVMVGGRSCVSKSDQYRRLARACLELARRAEDQQARASLRHMAQVWFRLAEERVSEVDERQSAER
jgi:putative ABC transport system substrate-binding protein